MGVDDVCKDGLGWVGSNVDVRVVSSRTRQGVKTIFENVCIVGRVTGLHGGINERIDWVTIMEPWNTHTQAHAKCGHNRLLKKKENNKPINIIIKN